MRYAEKTSVSADKSRAEIDRILLRYGASGFAYGWEGNRAMIGFKMQDRQIRFVIELPGKDDPDFARSPQRRRMRSPEDRLRLWEQATRQKWRALALAVKAKLEAVESGIATFEQEFLAYILLPNGETAGSWMIPQIETAYDTGRMPKLLAGLSESREVN